MKFKSVIVGTSLICSMAFSQSLTATSGWSLLGTNTNVSDISTSFGSAKSVWKYSGGKWYAISPDKSLTTALSGAGIQTFSSLGAGDGFWVNNGTSTNITINLTGTVGSQQPAITSGWQLISPIKDISSVSSQFGGDTNITTIWKYASGKWEAYSPQSALMDQIDKAGIDELSSVNVGEGFWVNASGTSDALSSPPSIMSGSISLEGLESTTTSQKILYAGDGFASGSVQLYKVNDQDYTTPLLTNPVPVNSDGTYAIELSDFKSEFQEYAQNPDASYIVRAIVKKTANDKPVELSAVKTKDAQVDISPITTAVKSKIIETINTFFGSTSEDVVLSEAILQTVDTLAKQIVEAVQTQVQQGNMTFKTADFVASVDSLDDNQAPTADALAARKAQEEKLNSDLASQTEVSGTVAILQNKISEEIENDIVNSEDFDLTTLDKTSSLTDNVPVATLAYKYISNIAKSGLPVHRGDGRVILFLPVPSEEFATLPGKKFALTVETDDGNKTIGDDPALRVVDLATDLKNTTGFEVWAQDLHDMMHSPIMPLEAVKAMLRNSTVKTNLFAFGEALKEAAGDFVKENPFVDFNGTTINGANDILSPFQESYVDSSFDWLFWEGFWRAYERAKNGDNNELSSYVDIFGVAPDDTKESLYDRIYQSDLIADIQAKVSKLLNAAIPYDVEDTNATLLQFGIDGGVVINDATVITPMTAFALTNLVMETAGSQEAPVPMPKTIQDVFGFIDTSMLGDIQLPDQIWFPEYEMVDQSALSKVLFDTTGDSDPATMILEEKKWMMNFILQIVNATTGSTLSSTNIEPAYIKMISNTIEAVMSFEEKMMKAQNQEQQMGGFDNVEYVDGKFTSTVKFKIFDNEGKVNSKISYVKFVPMLDDVVNYQWVEANSSTIFKLDDGVYERNITLRSYELALDLNLSENVDGDYRQTDMFAVYINSEGEDFFFGHFPIFAIPTNDLGEFWFDGAFYNNDTTTDTGSFGGFQEYKFDFSEKTSIDLFYPMLTKTTGEQVGENILTITEGSGEGEFILSAINNMIGTLQGGSIETYVLARNWEESQNRWFTGDFDSNKTLDDQITIGYDLDSDNTANSAYDVNEGGLILIHIKSPQLQEIRLLATIEYIGPNGPKLNLEPVYFMPDITSGFGDVVRVKTDITAKVMNFNGVPSSQVKEIGFRPTLMCEDGTYIKVGYAFDVPDTDGQIKVKGTLMQNSGKYSIVDANLVSPNARFSITQYGEDNNVTYDPNGSCWFTGNIAIKLKGQTDSGTFEEPFGEFPIYAQDQNDLGEFWYEYWDSGSYDEYKPEDDPYMSAPMYPENEMTTKVIFKIPSEQASKVQSIVLTRVLYDEMWNWVLDEEDNVTITGNNGVFEGNVTLYPEYHSTPEVHETAHFRFLVKTTDDQMIDIGWFPLFAMPENNLAEFYLDPYMFGEYSPISDGVCYNSEGYEEPCYTEYPNTGDECYDNNGNVVTCYNDCPDGNCDDDFVPYDEVKGALQGMSAQFTSQSIPSDIVVSGGTFYVLDSQKAYTELVISPNSGEGNFYDYELGSDCSFTKVDEGTFWIANATEGNGYLVTEGTEPSMFLNIVATEQVDMQTPTGAVTFLMHEVEEVEGSVTDVEAFFQDVPSGGGAVNVITTTIKTMNQCTY